MKKFKWQEVIDFLEENKNERFNFGNPFSKENPLNGDKCNCLLARFFDAQGVDFYTVAPNGGMAWGGRFEPVAIIEDQPYTIGKVHFGNKEGAKILAEIRKCLEES